MLKLTIKLSPIPELKCAKLSKQDLEPVWRSAANGVATVVKTHFRNWTALSEFTLNPTAMAI